MTNLPSDPTPSPHSPTEWWSSPWFRRHAVAAPFGIFAVTWLLCWRATGQWERWQHLELASSFVDLATIIYGMFAVTFEMGVKIVFWAIEQWKNQRARDRAEGAQYALKLVRPKLTKDEYDAAIKRLEREFGVNGKN